MTTAYLQDAFASNFAAQLTEWHDDPQPGERWVLVDGALAGAERMAHLRGSYHEPVAVFEDTHLQGYEELGLFLWPMASVWERDRAAALLQNFNAMPSPGFLKTCAPVDAVRQTLAWLAGARTADDMRLYLRIGDARVVQTLPAALSASQMTRLTSSISAWAVPGRAGHFQRLSLASTRHRDDSDEGEHDGKPGIVIDNTAYRRIFNAALADMLYAELHRADAAGFAAPQMSSVHQWLQGVIERAQQKGVRQFADQVEFARIARRASAMFEHLPELAATWAALESGTTPLTTLRQQWGAAQWQAIELNAQAKP